MLLICVIVYKYRMWCMSLIVFLFSFYSLAKPEGEGKSAAPHHIPTDLLFALHYHTVTWLQLSHFHFCSHIVSTACVKQTQAPTVMMVCNQHCHFIIYELDFLSRWNFYFIHVRPHVMYMFYIFTCRPFPKESVILYIIRLLKLFTQLSLNYGKRAALYMVFLVYQPLKEFQNTFTHTSKH